jgi:hypothetical protein
MDYPVLILPEAQVDGAYLVMGRGFQRLFPPTDRPEVIDRLVPGDGK